MDKPRAAAASDRESLSSRQTGIVQASGLTRRYIHGSHAVYALRDVDLNIGQGEFVAVTGPSGAGKSTLLHLIGGIDRPDQGEIWVESRALSTLSETELAHLRRRRIGFVLQFFNLFPSLSALENVAFPLLLDGISDSLPRAREALAKVGLSGREDHRPAELSGGEQQRVAIARAIVVEPALVLADEPTGNLDSSTGEDVLKLFRQVSDWGTTVVLVTHDGRTSTFADRMLHLSDGRMRVP